MQKSTSPTEAPDVEAYLVHADRLRLEIAEYERRRNALSDPALLTEGDLHDAALLDAVFFRHKGKQEGDMSLAGIKVHKTLAAYPTNSGKNRGYHVRFDWVGSDGVAHFSEKVPPELKNRRNDSERNWGLHE